MGGPNLYVELGGGGMMTERGRYLQEEGRGARWNHYKFVEFVEL